jgi:hypothetical protein
VSGVTTRREEDVGWYLYGVVAADAAPGDLSAQAVDPHFDVGVLAEGAVAGVTSRVSLDEFDESSLPERLADAAWLEQKIRSHEQVLEGVLASAPVVPCRFCTVYRNEDDLRRFLLERGDALADALGRVRGRVELGVKAFVERERFAAGRALENESIRELSERVSQSAGGRAYLEARRLDQAVAAELARFKDEVGAQLHERLLAAAEDGVLLPLQRPEVSGRDDEMVFNSAYLVADRERFARELAAVRDDYRDGGVELELTGPWPPYNFVPAELSSS